MSKLGRHIEGGFQQFGSKYRINLFKLQKENHTTTEGRISEQPYLS